jgi:hypothetical protein
MSATAAGLEKPGAPVATVAAAGRETRAPQASVAADVRRLKSSCSQPSTFNSQPAANQRGGLGKAHQLFGEQLNNLLEELNTTLAA